MSKDAWRVIFALMALSPLLGVAAILYKHFVQ